MQTTIIPIGNSKGIRIPKAVLEQCGFESKVEMQVMGNSLILSKPKRNPREGWAEQIDAEIKKHGLPEKLWESDFFEDEMEMIEEEWKW